MDRTENSDLLELQELAFQHRIKKRKTLVEKSMIVRAHLINHVPIGQLCADFGVSPKSVYRWIHTFADGKVPGGSTGGHQEVKPRTPTMPRKKHEPAETEAEELARLREENRRLAEALRASEWMCHAKDVMIDEAEKAFGIPIRKKSGAKQ